MPSMLNGIRWVLFDAVGTLIYPDPPVAHVYQAVAARFGSRLSMKEIDARFRRSLAAEQTCGAPTSEANERERWRRIVGAVIDDVPADGNAVFEQLWTHFAQPQSWRLFADVQMTLARLHQRGYRLGIASNFDDRLNEVVRGHSGLARLEIVFVSSDLGFTKPHLQFFRAVEERLGAERAQIALVGDDEVSDVQGATAAGWRAIRLDRCGECSGAGTILSLGEMLP